MVWDGALAKTGAPSMQPALSQGFFAALIGPITSTIGQHLRLYRRGLLDMSAMDHSERYAQAARSEDVRGRLRVCASDQGLFIAAQV